MRKCMFLLVAMTMGFAVLSDVKPASAAQSGVQALTPMYAGISCMLHGSGAGGDFAVYTSAYVNSVVSYTVRFRGHTNGDFSFPIYGGDCSTYFTFSSVAMGRAEIVAVYPASDGVYDYTAGIGAETEW